MGNHIFAETRRTSPWLVLVSAGVYVASTIMLFNSEYYRQYVVWPIRTATGGLCNPTLLHGAITLTLSVGIILLGFGGLRLRDTGIRRENLVGALAGSLALWSVVQGVAVITALVGGSGLAIHEQWTTEGVPVVLGKLIGQLFGNALCEETMFRGLLIAQLYFLLEQRSSCLPRRRMAAAIIIAQVFFAVSHLPNRLAQGNYDNLALILADQSMLIFMGLVFALVYLQTRNLLLAVAVHALINAPTMLVASPLDSGGWTQGLILALTLIALATKSLVARVHMRNIAKSDTTTNGAPPPP